LPASQENGATSQPPAVETRFDHGRSQGNTHRTHALHIQRGASTGGVGAVLPIRARFVVCMFEAFQVLAGLPPRQAAGMEGV
jgi:hypothetical protein